MCALSSGASAVIEGTDVLPGSPVRHPMVDEGSSRGATSSSESARTVWQTGNARHHSRLLPYLRTSSLGTACLRVVIPTHHRPHAQSSCIALSFGGALRTASPTSLSRALCSSQPCTGSTHDALGPLRACMRTLVAPPCCLLLILGLLDWVPCIVFCVA